MADERTHPCLPCRDVDESVAFYAALGFTRTYKQQKPNPYAVVARGDVHIHLFGVPDFDPAGSYGNVIVVVPDAEAMYDAFATGLRAAYGKLPATGIPRILRPRRKLGTVSGFSVVDPGGNWLRVYRAGDTDVTEKISGLAGILDTAARLGDAKGDDATALATVRRGLERHVDAPAVDRARALLYCCELAVRVDDRALARTSFDDARALSLTEDERAALAADFAAAAELLQ